VDREQHRRHSLGVIVAITETDRTAEGTLLVENDSCLSHFSFQFHEHVKPNLFTARASSLDLPRSLAALASSLLQGKCHSYSASRKLTCLWRPM